MKKIISYKDFCEEKGLVISSKKSQAEYQRYTNECEIENRPHLDDIFREAEKIKNAKK
ncbi:hypothetical protein [Motilimonas cestriensis]|uniref:hypothetical protein n=1 Tax=Motilimonas cestriensis TaxID=2742685 RepID=UPI003DA689E7